VFQWALPRRKPSWDWVSHGVLVGFDQDLKQPLKKKMSATQSHEMCLRIRCCHAKAVLLNIECTIGCGSINTS